MQHKAATRIEIFCIGKVYYILLMDATQQQPSEAA
jgi:hypothetical protein